MAFGRAKPEEPVAQVDWELVREFTVGTVERPATRKRNWIGWGAKAVRVPQGSKDDRVLAPCAYVGPEQALFLDPEGTRLLCSVDSSEEHHFVVRDALGEVIGMLTRVPSRRPLRPTWRMEQPGHPEIAGRTEWLSGEPREIAARAAGKVFGGVLDALTDLGAEGGDQLTKDRVLEWRTADEMVMTSEGAKSAAIKASWLDRRLAFAYLLVANKS